MTQQRDEQQQRPPDPWIVWWWKNLSTLSRVVFVLIGSGLFFYVLNRL